MFSESPDKKLIGIAGSKALISTPALLLDLDTAEENILKMAEFAGIHKISLRPHCKGHKSPLIAGLQMTAGAIGISCATIEEAEELFKGGIQNILITSEIVLPQKIKSLIELNEKASELLAIVDKKENVQDLIDILEKTPSAKKPLHLLVDIDIGQGFSGVKTVEDAVSLAQMISKSPLLRFAGIQAYAEHTTYIQEYEERKILVEKQNEFIKHVIEELKKSELTCSIITGGGTDTFEIDMKAHVYTELQVGSYLFMDVHHTKIPLTKETLSPFKPSLFVLTSVISTEENAAITNGGLKAFATDGAPPEIYSSSSIKLTYEFVGDEHGKIHWTDPKEALQIGEKITCLTPRSDLTVNLYDYFHCIRKDVLVDLWPVQARGVH